MRGASVSARFFPGFFIFLLAAITFSFGTADGFYATGRSGTLAEKSTQTPYIAAREANRLILAVERKDLPQQPGWSGPDLGLPAGHFLMRFLGGKAAHGAGPVRTSPQDSLAHGFLARGPPIAVA